MYTNIGQTVGGGLGLLEMGYDTTIDTEIGYKKVDGLINNYDEGVVEDTRIFGLTLNSLRMLKRVILLGYGEQLLKEDTLLLLD